MLSNKLWNLQSKEPSPTSTTTPTKGLPSPLSSTTKKKKQQNTKRTEEQQQSYTIKLQKQQSKTRIVQSSSTASLVELARNITIPSTPSGSFICNVDEDENKSRVVQVAKLFFDEYLHHEAMDPLMSPKCIIQFAEAEMLGYAFLEEGVLLRQSFPDMNFAYESVTEIAPNTAFLSSLGCTVAHTGTPHGFGPCPAWKQPD